MRKKPTLDGTLEDTENKFLSTTTRCVSNIFPIQPGVNQIHRGTEVNHFELKIDPNLVQHTTFQNSQHRQRCRCYYSNTEMKFSRCWCASFPCKS